MNRMEELKKEADRIKEMAERRLSDWYDEYGVEVSVDDMNDIMESEPLSHVEYSFDWSSGVPVMTCSITRMITFDPEDGDHLLGQSYPEAAKAFKEVQKEIKKIISSGDTE